MKVGIFTQGSESSGSLQLKLTSEPAQLHLTRSPFGIVIELEDCQPTGEPGGPGLPGRVFRVALPINTHVAQFSAKAAKTVQLTREPELLAPLQPHRPGPTNQETERLFWEDLPAVEDVPIKPSSRQMRGEPFVQPLPPSPFVPPRVELYEREIRTQRAFARLITTEYAGSVPIAIVEVTPIRLIENGLLEFAPEIEVAITYAQQERAMGFVRKIHSFTQAKRLVDLTRAGVVNPEAVGDLTQSFPPQINQVDYLIITDNYLWPQETIPTGGILQHGDNTGNLVQSFQRLADWKAKRGLKSRVVTVSDIVAGKYGNFTTGVRDLQETIRNFLKWALQAWGISWVLLGGDTEIIPVRRVAGYSHRDCGEVTLETIDPPAANQSFWTGTFLKVHLVRDGWGPAPDQNNLLVNPATGQVINYGDTATLPHWHFCTSDSYTVFSKNPTEFIRVVGPESIINAPLQWLYIWNTVPTDLYYASLQGPNYSQPGRHDWDLNNNGVYAQHTPETDFDGVEYHTDVSVGRAPVSNEAQANAFVNKVIAYEQFRRPDGATLNVTWPKSMLLASANWANLCVWPTQANPPDKEQYYHPQDARYSLLRLKQTPSDQRRLIAQVTQADVRILPYDRNAAISGRGWFYAKSASDLTPSETSFWLMGIFYPAYPIPTEWLVVYGSPEELTPPVYIFDMVGADDSMHDQEQLRHQIQAELPSITHFARLYEDKVDLTPAEAAVAPLQTLTAEQLRNALNAGPHFVSLSGHGNPDGCCWLSRDMAQNLTNGYQTFIAYADSCLTNQFDGEDAVSEQLLYNPNGGAVAYIGNSRFSWIGVGDDFQRAFFHGLASTRHLGLLNDTRCALLDTAWRGDTKWAIFSLNLMGDPEMPVWVPALPGPEYFNAIWVKSSEDRPAVWGWKRSDFDGKQAEMQAKGYKLTELNAFVLPTVGECFNAIWVKSSEDRPAVWGWKRNDFDGKQAEMQAKGYKLIELNAFVLPNVGECFNAIWVKNTEDRPAVWGWKRSDFDNKQAEMQAKGYKLAKLNAFVLPNVGECFNAIWVKNTEDRPAVWGWAHWDLDRYASGLEAQGYRLDGINAFVLP